jgi:hypothetical protein
MLPRKPIASFLCGFIILYAIFALPWPGWEGIYGSYFRGLARMVFAANDGRRELNFITAQDTVHPLYTRIEIVNREMIHADGSGPVRNLDIDARAFGWKPTALFLALVIATPVPWRRRWRALLWGALCVQLFILLFLGFCIWDESAEVSLVTLEPFWKQIIDGTRAFAVSQYAMAIPLVVWLAVTFRSEDRFGDAGLSLLGAGKEKARVPMPPHP